MTADRKPATAPVQQGAPDHPKPPELNSKPLAPSAKPQKKTRPDYVRTDPVGAFWGKPVSVIQFEVAVAEAAGMRDADAARGLSGLELTERLSTTGLVSIEAALRGKKARQQLVAMADESAFLDPPATEIPALAPPDISTQRSMLAMTVACLDKTIPNLPSFLTTETAALYEDWSDESAGGHVWRAKKNSKLNVMYSGGNEEAGQGKARRRNQNGKENGPVTNSVFGPLLSVVLLDSAKGKISWSQWERGVNQPRAVFRYQVPETQSHYEIYYRSPIVNRLITVERQRIGYHGEVAIDPSSGIVLRLTLQADLDSNLPVDRNDTMVEYGPVEMDGKTYNLPVRGVTIASGVDAAEGDDNSDGGFGPEETVLQDITFGSYHVAGSKLRASGGNAPAVNEK